MKISGVDAAVREVQAVFDVGAIGSLTDGELLDRFIIGRDEAVFEALLRRHGPLVWGVCRRILRDHHDAEDAFQATFLVLARRATSVNPRDKVGRWLYGVAYQTALKARATGAKRRGREHQRPDLIEVAAVGEDRRDDSLAELDGEVGRLPAKYRIPVILCELEGKTHREAADQLGWPIGTVSGRLSRARTMLAKRLSRYASGDSGGLMFVAMTQTRKLGSVIVPARLISPSARAACRMASGKLMTAGVISAEVATLMEGVLKTMLLSKIKLTTAAVLMGLALTAGGTSLAYLAGTADGPGQAKSDRKAKGQNPRSEEPQPAASKPQITAVVAQKPPADPMTSYPFKIDPESVYEFPDLTVEYRNLRLRTGSVSVVPISSERGIAGAMVIGNGTFRYAPEKDKVIEGPFHSAMLRFNPDDQAAILPLEKGKKVSDQGISEMSRHLLQVVIKHCYQSTKDGGRRQEILIPPKGAIAVVLYSKEHGDLLISSDERSGIAFCFTDRKTLYEKK